jgi:hypothetical protein
MSHDDLPAPAIDETIEKAKNIITDRLSNQPAPDIAVAARLARLIVQDPTLPDDRQHDVKTQEADKQQRAAPPQQQRQSRRHRRRRREADVP